MRKKNVTKHALLASVLAMVLCVTMLVGTTFAWFTDTASANVNKIQSGNLEIDLQDGNGNSLEGKTLGWVAKDGRAQEKILWEPGCTYNLTPFKIVNKGNLALKYQITVNGVTGNAKLLEAIDFTAKIGSKDPVALETMNGVLLPTGKTSTVTGEESGESSLITISGHMKESAGNEYRDLSIENVGITVVATQYTYESDSKDNQYDVEAAYPAVVSVTPDTIPSPFRANTTYYFEVGNYGEQQFVIYESENVTLIGKSGAKFDSLQISSIDYDDPVHNNPINLGNSTLTVKGFEVVGTLLITEADKNIVVKGNTAAQITVKMNMSSQSVAVNKNSLTGGNGAVNGYGVYIVPNTTDYDLTVTGNTFSSIPSHAISVQGCGDGSAVTAARSITVTENTFTSYGTGGKTGRAAFKIWEDTKLAPNGTDPLNDTAKALAAAVAANNTFAADLGNNCVVADFYGKTVAFS